MAEKIDREIPNPGSPEALGLGCTCPVLDNGHGRGVLGSCCPNSGDPLFWIDEACPLHGRS